MSVSITLQSDSSGITSGDTYSYTVADSEHPATGWTLSAIHRMGTNLLAVAGVASDTSFTVTLSAAQTTALFPGMYARAFRFTEVGGSARVETEYGCDIRVYPNLASATVGPRRAAYNAALAQLNLLTISGNQSVSFNGQSFTKQSSSELLAIVDRLHRDALEEDRELGIGNKGGLVRIVTRM